MIETWLRHSKAAIRYILRTPKLLVGLVMLGSLLLLGLLGPQFVDVEKARPISVPTRNHRQPNILWAQTAAGAMCWRLWWWVRRRPCAWVCWPASLA